MKSLVGAIVLAFALAGRALASGPQDEAAIRVIVDAETSAWNAGDGVAYSRRFAEGGTFTNVLGNLYIGHAAFEQRHVEIFGTIFKGSTLRQTIRRLQFVTPDVALVDIETELDGVPVPPPGVRLGQDGRMRTRLLQVFVRRDGEWWIEAYHNVDVKQAPAPPASPR